MRQQWEAILHFFSRLQAHNIEATKVASYNPRLKPGPVCIKETMDIRYASSVFSPCHLI